MIGLFVLGFQAEMPRQGNNAKEGKRVMDKPTGDNADQGTGEQAPVADTPPKTQPDDYYKGLQRKIGRLQTELEAERSRFNEMLGVLGTSEDLTEARPRMAAVQEKAGQQSKEAERDHATAELEETLAGSGISLDDWRSQPKFAVARTAWRQAAFDDAHSLTKQALGQADPEARAEQLYQEKMRRLGKVDTGERGTGGDGLAHKAYVERLKKGESLPSPEEIDRIVAQQMKGRL